KPVIAAVNGPALGAGLGLMSACDIFYASENATFGMPEINVGLAGGASMLKTLFGRSTMRRMFYTGVRLTAAELLERSILEKVTSREALVPTAMAVAQDIASKSPLAIKYAKQAMTMVEYMPQRDAYRMEQNYTMALAETDDAKEARMAFLEKREPKFTGR
ncbi:MAG: enoyl-CoA hydratase-related protein, partial [Pseudooceanicola nanhaiensis]